MAQATGSTATGTAPAKPAGTNGATHTNGANGHSTGNGKNGNTSVLEASSTLTAVRVSKKLLDRAGVAIDMSETSTTVRSDQFARFQADAPACDNCGAITVRNGNCYLCHNCGNSMGCS